MRLLGGLFCHYQGFVQGYAGLAIARVFLGAAEGAILPGSVAYLSEFYRRRGAWCIPIDICF